MPSTVLATKFSTSYRAGTGRNEIMANRTGNGTKSLHVSVECSLKKLKTSYIDLVGCLSWMESFESVNPAGSC